MVALTKILLVLNRVEDTDSMTALWFATDCQTPATNASLITYFLKLFAILVILPYCTTSLLLPLPTDSLRQVTATDQRISSGAGA